MQTYQFIIIITIILIIPVIIIIKSKVQNNQVESFEGLKSTDIFDKNTFATTLPKPGAQKEVEKQPTETTHTFFNSLHLDYADPLPGDDTILKDEEKIYFNPIFPDEKLNPTKKSTAKKGQTPKQNFPTPSDMPPSERDAFQFGYPNEMTMQDYVNWLSLFRRHPTLLNLEHAINYEKLINGVPIYYKKDRCPPPAKRLTPLNAEDYFLQMYTKAPEKPYPELTRVINEDVRVATNQGSNTNGIMPANYNEYGDFKQNFDVMGNTQYIYNDELADKTDPYFLRVIVGPNWTIKGRYANY